MKYLTSFTIPEIICFIFSLICLEKDENKAWIGQIIYLFTVCIAELEGVYLKLNHQPNQWPYNLLLISQITLITFMFWDLLKKNHTLKVTIFCVVIVLSFIYLIEIFEHGIFRFNSLTYNTMSVIFVIYSLYYFYLQLKVDSYINLLREAEFWWVSGVLFFYFGVTAINLFRGKLSLILVTPKHALPYYILAVLNIILHGFWTYSFICRKWLMKK